MSIEALRDEMRHLIEDSDYDSLVRAKDALLNNGSEEADWWDDMSDEQRASLEEGMRQADAGETISYEDFKQQNRKWFPQ